MRTILLAVALFACSFPGSGGETDANIDAMPPPDGLPDTPTDGACTKHIQCASATCTPLGCAAETDISYISETGTDGTGCTRAAPCRTPQWSMRKIMRVSGSVFTADEVQMSDGSMLIGVDSARITNIGTAAAVVRFDQAAGQIWLRDIALRGKRSLTWCLLVIKRGGGAPGMQRVDVSGLDVRGCSRGVHAFDDGLEFDIRDSLVIDNDRGLFLTTSVKVSVTNTIIARNREGLVVGALGVRNIGHITVADNDVGVWCVHNAAIFNSILSGNRISTMDSCAIDRSIVDDYPSSELFVDPAGLNFHLRPASPAIDRLFPTTTLTDIDGDLRDSKPDFGADEFIHVPSTF